MLTVIDSISNRAWESSSFRAWESSQGICGSMQTMNIYLQWMIRLLNNKPDHSVHTPRFHPIEEVMWTFDQVVHWLPVVGIMAHFFSLSTVYQLRALSISFQGGGCGSNSSTGSLWSHSQFYELSFEKDQNCLEIWFLWLLGIAIILTVQ